MQKLLKSVYMMDNKGIKKSTERLWNRYQSILNNRRTGWPEINEARAILYFLGYFFVEQIALTSLEKRLKFIKPKISFDEFLLAIDENNEMMMKKYEKNKKFQTLQEFYLLIKQIKNRINRDNSYLDEATFNKLYRNLKPKNYF